VIALVLIPADAAVVADLQRLGVERAVSIAAHAPAEQIVPQRVRGASVMVFASPRRRWAEVMDVIRAALQATPRDVALRFYEPTCLLDLRVRAEGDERWWICPHVTEPADGAWSVRKALAAGVKDLELDEQRARRAELLERLETMRRAA
jgi:hypothetical protein